jgi:hypothetical protein
MVKRVLRKDRTDQKEGTMEIKDYCGTLAAELGAWKAKVDDVTEKLDRVSSGDKQRVVPMVNELHMILEELDDRVGKLKAECTTQWGPENIGVEARFQPRSAEWQEEWKATSPGDIGG